jgi:hypothetical protein
VAAFGISKYVTGGPQENHEQSHDSRSYESTTTFVLCLSIQRLKTKVWAFPVKATEPHEG